MSSVVIQGETQVARPLKVLVTLIKEDLKQGDEAAERAGMPFYRAAGEKMLEAKGQLPVGDFMKWVERNFSIKRSQANTYMSLSVATAGRPITAATDFSSLKDFRRNHLGHDVPTSGGGVRQPTWRADVDDLAEKARVAQARLERQHEDSMTRQQEREAERLLGLKLIDIGYRVLAKELHPDKGGSRDTMQRLSRVKDRLKASV